MKKKKTRCYFPIKAVRNIFPNAKVGLAKHYASRSEWNRKKTYRIITRYRYKPNFFLQLPQNFCLVFLLSVPKSAPHRSHLVLIIIWFQFVFNQSILALNVRYTINWICNKL